MKLIPLFSGTNGHRWSFRRLKGTAVWSLRYPLKATSQPARRINADPMRAIHQKIGAEMIYVRRVHSKIVIADEESLLCRQSLHRNRVFFFDVSALKSGCYLLCIGNYIKLKRRRFLQFETPLRRLRFVEARNFSKSRTVNRLNESNLYCSLQKSALNASLGAPIAHR
jgi:hypothetical protein